MSSDEASGSDLGLMAPGDAHLGGEIRSGGDSSADDEDAADGPDPDLGLMAPGHADAGEEERNAGDSSADDEEDADEDDDGIQEDPSGSSGGMTISIILYFNSKVLGGHTGHKTNYNYNRNSNVKQTSNSLRSIGPKMQGEECQK